MPEIQAKSGSMMFQNDIIEQSAQKYTGFFLEETFLNRNFPKNFELQANLQKKMKSDGFSYDVPSKKSILGTFWA